MKSITVAVLMMSILPCTLLADERLERELKQDVVLRALVDELGRGKTSLKLGDLAGPYFIEYNLLDTVRAYVSASLGSVTHRNQYRSRGMSSDVRVGSYELDNSNFRGGGGMGFGGGAIPIEDDYLAIRQAIWWITDRDYKGVVELLEKKKAFMESKMIKDKPDDFSRESPVVHFDDRLHVSVDLDRLEKIAVGLSRLFRKYPDIQRSNVLVQGIGGNKYLINTEGTRMRSARMRYWITVTASVQVEDGMRMSDSLSIHARSLQDFPSLEELSTQCREMAEALIEAGKAPRFQEAYAGPVLFDAPAANAVFARWFAGRFGGGQRPVGSRTSPDDFANKINQRILPRFIDVIDDPTRKVFGDVQAMGHYDYDNQGVPAQAVNLIKNGRLVGLLMSRNPSKRFKKSNGHGRVSFGTGSNIGCLSVTADPSVQEAELKQELIEAFQDEGLEFGIRIASLGGSSGGRVPLHIYVVHPDGKEERVRGAQFSRIDLRAFKYILAGGDTQHVFNSGASGGQTIAVPALLFEELDLVKIDRDFDKPPILPPPLSRSSK